MCTYCEWEAKPLGFSNVMLLQSLFGYLAAMPTHETIDYVEFPATDLDATKRFFVEAFGWAFTDYGPDYTAFERAHAGLDGGFFRSEHRVNANQGSALIVFYSAALEATQAKVEAAGGTITTPTFSFPGGRRFHFACPSGNEYAVWSDTEV
ncbi:MAG: VOC family protein [Rhodothermales bacterium]